MLKKLIITLYRVANKIIRRLQSSSSTASSTVDIKIPDRIERGPTDILRVCRNNNIFLSFPNFNKM